MTSVFNKGVQAVAVGLQDGGVKCAYNYPGFFSQDIFSLLGGCQISLNERVAYAEAFGSSLAGKRSAVMFKNVGLNIASDAFLHSIISGVRGGMVLVLTDDVAVWGSQESQDSRPYFDFFGGLWLEPASLQEAYDFARTSFELSERYDVPIVLRLTNAYFELDGSFARTTPSKHPATLKPLSNTKYVVHPYFFERQYKNLALKNRMIARAYDKGSTNGHYKRGVIIVGAADPSYVVPKNTDLLRVTSYPLPAQTIKNFVDAHSSVDVVEQGDPYAAGKIQQIVSDKKIKSLLPKKKGQKWPFVRWSRYEEIFQAIALVENCMVISDVTQFTVETKEAVQACLSLGTSISTAIGYGMARTGEYTLCLSGDCSFLHEGVGIIDEVVRRDLSLGIVVFDNGGSWCTGGQSGAGDICGISKNKSVTIYKLDASNVSTAIMYATLQSMRKTKGVAILFLKLPMGSFERD